MKKRRGSLLFGLVIVMFVFFCTITVVKLKIETNRLEVEKAQLEIENTEIRDDIDRFQSTLDSPKDDEYYEEKARDKLNLRLPEEIIFYNDLIN